MNENTEDFRVMVNMNYLGMNAAVATDHSIILKTIEEVKSEFSKQQLSIATEYLKNKLSLADKEFTKLFNGGQLNSSSTLSMVKESGEVILLSWQEFCAQCVDLAVMEYVLNDNPIRLVANAGALEGEYKIEFPSPEDDKKLRESGMVLPRC